MDKESLYRLKKFISGLSEDDLRNRDKYLKGLSNGEIQGPKVGYSSIDKQWVQYFDLDNYSDFESKTVYQGLVDSNKAHLDSLAIEFFGTKISFRELFKNIEKTAKSFEEYGVTKGSFVTICSPGIPETVYSFYALSKIGAVSNMIAPYFDQIDFVERLIDCDSEILIVADIFYDKIKDSVKKTNIKKIIVVPTLNSSRLRFFKKRYKIDKNNNEVYWNDFIKEGNSRELSSTVNYEPSMPLSMVYSSGTTGSAKGILLSNDSFQNSIYSYFKSGLDISRGQKFYQIIPTWFSTGISTSIHLPLSCGASVYMDPRYEREIFVSNIIKAKPNYTVAPTSMYEGLLDNPKLKNRDLSYFRNAFQGGEPLSKELAEKINKKFREHGNNSSIKVGYGQCECGATITTQTDLTEHCNNSVGIPLPGINIQICDNNLNELPTGERGQIVVATDSGMIGYFKNQQATDDYFYIDPFNKKWSCTGDIGYFDKNGNLFVEGRAADYTEINGEKIYNFDIEKIIREIPGIKITEVLPKKNDVGKEELAAHLILDDPYFEQYAETFFEQIQEKVFQETNNPKMVPKTFKLRREFPHGPSGKRDIIKIKKEQEGFTYKEPIKVLTKQRKSERK